MIIVEILPYLIHEEIRSRFSVAKVAIFKSKALKKIDHLITVHTFAYHNMHTHRLYIYKYPIIPNPISSPG